MTKRLSRTLLFVACLAGSVPNTRVSAQDLSQGEKLVQRLPAAPDPKRTVTLTYAFTRTTSKYKGTEERVAAKLTEYKTQLEQAMAHMDAAERQKEMHDVLGHFESLLREGSTATYDGQAEIAPDYQAVAEKKTGDEHAKWDWTIRRGDKLSEYSEFNESAHVSKVPRGRETSLSLFMQTVGLFGKPDPYIAARLREAKTVKTDGAKITVEIDHGTVVFVENPEHQLLLESYASWKGDPVTVKFEDYRTFKGVWTPMRITRDVSTAEFDIRSAYRLETVEIDGELTVPFAAARIEAE